MSDIPAPTQEDLDLDLGDYYARCSEFMEQAKKNRPDWLGPDSNMVWSELVCKLIRVAKHFSDHSNKWSEKAFNFDLAHHKLHAAVKKHHDQKADDRCVLDDTELYAAAGLPPADHRVGDKFAMMKNCLRFIENRCEGGGWPTYAELEQAHATLKGYLVAISKSVMGREVPFEDLPGLVDEVLQDRVDAQRELAALERGESAPPPSVNDKTPYRFADNGWCWFCHTETTLEEEREDPAHLPEEVFSRLMKGELVNATTSFTSRDYTSQEEALDDLRQALLLLPEMGEWKPFYLGGRSETCWFRAGSCRNNTDPKWNLPTVVFDLLEGGKVIANSEFTCRDYPSATEAMEALYRVYGKTYNG